MDLDPFVSAALESCAAGVMILDTTGAVVFANRVAKQTLPPEPTQQREAIARANAGFVARKHIVVNGKEVGALITLPPRESTVTLAERERVAILEALQATGWRRAEVARRLGLSRTTLWRRLRSYAIRNGGMRL